MPEQKGSYQMVLHVWRQHIEAEALAKGVDPLRFKYIN
jgi:hypothetical protein